MTTVGQRTKSASSLTTNYKQEHYTAKMMFLHGNNATGEGVLVCVSVG